MGSGTPKFAEIFAYEKCLCLHTATRCVRTVPTTGLNNVSQNFRSQASTVEILSTWTVMDTKNSNTYLVT